MQQRRVSCPAVPSRSLPWQGEKHSASGATGAKGGLLRGASGGEESGPQGAVQGNQG